MGLLDVLHSFFNFMIAPGKAGQYSPADIVR